MDQLKIRKAKKGDLKEIFRIEESCFQGDAFNKRQFSYLMHKANGEFLIVLKDDKVIGYLIILLRKNSSYARIYSLAVDPNMRGKGIAKELLKQAEIFSIKNRAIGIKLEVSENNLSAINLYKKNEYKSYNILSSYYSDGSSAIAMIKELGFSDHY